MQRLLHVVWVNAVFQVLEVLKINYKNRTLEPLMVMTFKKVTGFH
jgi:hypothetical protein